MLLGGMVEVGSSSMDASEFSSTIIEILVARNGSFLGRLAVIAYTEDSDPNGMLNTENGYNSAANLVDSDLDSGILGIDSGCVIEVFHVIPDAEERFLRMTGYFSEMGELAQRVCLAGGVILRIPPAYDEREQAEFIESFSEASLRQGLDVRIDRDVVDLPADDPLNPQLQAQAMASIRTALPQLGGVSDDRIRSILLSICSMGADHADHDAYVRFFSDIRDEFQSPPISAQLSPYDLGLLAGNASSMCPRAVGWFSAVAHEIEAQMNYSEVGPEPHLRDPSQISGFPHGNPVDPLSSVARPHQVLRRESNVGEVSASARRSISVREPNLTGVCERCRAATETGWKFCSSCGWTLG